jgi:glycerol-3-phosphate responsive antiterminator
MRPDGIIGTAIASSQGAKDLQLACVEQFDVLDRAA